MDSRKVKLDDGIVPSHYFVCHGLHRLACYHRTHVARTSLTAYVYTFHIVSRQLIFLSM